MTKKDQEFLKYGLHSGHALGNWVNALWVTMLSGSMSLTYDTSSYII